MKAIWKYILQPEHLQVPMPQGADLLTAREQGDDICVWAEVDTDAIVGLRFFEIFGTGHEMPTDMGADRDYIGTASLHGGALMFHVYERIGI